MNCLMIAAIEYNEFEGISKKIINQAKALSYNGNASLICFGKNCIKEIVFSKSILIEKKKLIDFSTANKGMGDKNIICDLLHAVEKVNIEDIKVVYIRHMLPSFLLVNTIRKIKKMGVRIVYEIPTYPYYKEQLKISNNKLRTLIKLLIETFFWPLIYQYIDLLCVVRCKSIAKMWKKMIPISNGYDGEYKKKECVSLSSIEMIGVGTIYQYHGYDRIIKAMKKCSCQTSFGVPIRFHIVGESKTVNILKKIAINNNIEKNVIFHGKMTSDDLMKFYKEMNLGVGTMRLSVRGADIDTAIKNIEYLANDLPIISSGTIFGLDDKTILYRQNEKDDISFDSIYSFIENYYSVRDQQIQQNILNSFSWNDIMKKIIEKFN